MRNRIPLDTYDRRALRRHRARADHRRWVSVAVGVAAVGVLVTGLVAIGGRALASRDAKPPAPRAAGATVTPAAVTTGVAETTAAPEAAPAGGETAGSEAPTITIAAVGDMLFDRKVKDLIEAQGGEAPLAEVAGHLSKADVTVGNLETTLAEGGKRITSKEPQYTFRGHPDGIEGLKLAGFDAVSLANNHMLDYGPDPMFDTIEALDDAGIGHSGAGKNTDAAWTPATIETENGAKVAYLAFTHILPAGFLASEDRPGVASGKRDMELVEEAVREAKKTHDYVLVSFHWGVEYEDYANGEQERNAKRVIDAGADMVLAHHPHVIQGVEFYGDGLIAYSLGDFVFDHYKRKTGEAFILDAELGPHGVDNVRATPVYLTDSHGEPEFVSGEEADVILKRLRAISKPHGTAVKIDDDVAVLTP